MTNSLRLILAVGFLTASTFAAGCNKVDDPLFCCTTAAACDEAGETEMFPCTDPSRPYCDNEGQYGPKRECIPNPGGACNRASDCTDPDLPFCVDQTCVACEGSTDCDVATPVCSGGHQCVGCTLDDDCAGRADTPRCLETSGACVGCVDAGDCTTATAPVCDETAHACRGCNADAECASEVCDVETGVCVADADVIYVAMDGVTSGTCTQGAPCSTITRGVGQVTSSRKMIKVRAGTYDEQVVIDGKALILHGDGATMRKSGAGQSVLIVSNGASATIEGVTIRGVSDNASVGAVLCQTSGATPTVLLRSVTVTVNSGIGVLATNCAVTLERSTLSSNAGGGISVSGGTFTLTNNFVVGNGGGSTLFGGIQVANIADAGTHVIDFNTIYNNNANDSFPAGINCPTVGTPLVFSNNIIFANESTDQVGGNMCAFTYSDIGPATVTHEGTGNIRAAPTFEDAANGKFHLLPGSAGIDVADPAATLAIDFDGEARPQNGRSDMGADEVTP